MSNPLAAYVASVLDEMQNNAELRSLTSRDAVVRAQTQLMNAKTENEMASAKLAVAESINRAIRENPQIALQIGVLQLANSGLLGGTGSSAPRLIGSSAVSSDPIDRSGFRGILGGYD